MKQGSEATRQEGSGLARQAEVCLANPIGESWEIADLPGEESVVTVGPMAGRTLRQVLAEWKTDLTGRAKLVDGRFPLLVKFLDAAQPLSVQVHPREERHEGTEARRHEGQATKIKHEAWYVIEAELGAVIYRGLREGVDASALCKAIEAGRVKEVLHEIPVRKGHCYFLPSGTIHALGGGVLVAEVQTPSDTTYRLYDWDRVDPVTGAARRLDIEEGLRHVLTGSANFAEERQEHVASVWTTVTSLVRCESFAIERVRMVDGVEQEIPYEEMVIWIVLEGNGSIRCEGLEAPISFQPGDTVLLPAGLKGGRVSVGKRSMWLEVTVPIESSLAGFDRPERASAAADAGGENSFVELRVSGKKRS